jgi:hypothetical protein
MSNVCVVVTTTTKDEKKISCCSNTKLYWWSKRGFQLSFEVRTNLTFFLLLPTYRPMSPKNLSFEKTEIWPLLWSKNWPLRSDICLQRIVSVVLSKVAVQKMFFYHLRLESALVLKRTNSPKVVWEAFFSATRFLYIKFANFLAAIRPNALTANCCWLVSFW